MGNKTGYTISHFISHDFLLLYSNKLLLYTLESPMENLFRKIGHLESIGYLQGDLQGNIFGDIYDCNNLHLLYETKT